MTPAQKAIARCAGSWAEKIAGPFQQTDMEKLLTILKDCKSDSIWGHAIRKVFDTGGHNYNTLITSLASQSIDDPLTMADIIGVTGTTLLLKYYDSKNPS